MSENANHQRKEMRQLRRRQDILEAAAEEFAEHGYHDASLRRIGDRVGLSKASLYYYVPSKSDLLAELLSDAAHAQPIQAGHGEPAERMRVFIRTHVNRVLNTVEGRALAETSAVLMSKTADPSLADARRKYEDVLVSILEAGITSGEFKNVPARPVVKFIFAGLNSIPQWYEAAGELPLDRIVEDIMSIILEGVVQGAPEGAPEALPGPAGTP